MNIYTNKIMTVSAPCGTGKTYAACMHIRNHLTENNWLYVAPTKKLLEQTKNQLNVFGVKAVCIHSDNTKNITESIIGHLKKSSTIGNVLLITWKAYSELPYFHKREHWHVFIDEVPQVDKLYQYHLDKDCHKDELLKHIEIAKAVNENIALVKARGSLANHIDKNQDDIDQTFRKLFQDVLNQNIDVFVDMKSFYSADKFWFISMVNPKLFKNTTLLGANIEHSIMYRWFRNYYDVQFEPNSQISQNLLNSSPVGDRLRVQYFSEKKFSKRLRDKQIKADAVVMDAIEKGVTEIVGDEAFLLVANNDYAGSLLDMPNVKRIQVDSKGMNEYQNFTTIVHLTALNREPKHQWMLNQLGVDDQTISQSTGYEVLYQNVMRTALRDKNSRQIVNVICADIQEAKHLSNLFGGVKIKRVGDLQFKKYVPFTQVQMNQRSRFKKVKEQMISVGNEEFTDMVRSSVRDRLYKNSNEYSKYLEPPMSSSKDKLYSLTFHAAHTDFHPEQFHQESFEPQVLFKLLKESASTTINSKDELFLLNPSTYRTSVPGTGFRTYENLQTTSLLVLDFDNGKLSVEDFENIFWKEAGRGQKRSFIICNTFSRSHEKPNNFRVFMPFKNPVTSIESYQAVYYSVVQRLEQYGFSAETSGLDQQSRIPNQSYWMPCINRAFPEWAYFAKYGCKSSELDRCSIDPIGCVKTSITSIKKTKVVELKSECSPGGSNLSEAQRLAKVEVIKSEYRAIPEGHGLRNDAFYIAALKLSNYMEWYEVKAIMHEIAGGDEKMIKRIPQKIQSVMKWKAQKAA